MFLLLRSNSISLDIARLWKPNNWSNRPQCLSWSFKVRRYELYDIPFLSSIHLHLHHLYYPDQSARWMKNDWLVLLIAMKRLMIPLEKYPNSYMAHTIAVSVLYSITYSGNCCSYYLHTQSNIVIPLIFIFPFLCFSILVGLNHNGIIAFSDWNRLPLNFWKICKGASLILPIECFIVFPLLGGTV